MKRAKSIWKRKDRTEVNERQPLKQERDGERRGDIRSLSFSETPLLYLTSPFDTKQSVGHEIG